LCADEGVTGVNEIPTPAASSEGSCDHSVEPRPNRHLDAWGRFGLLRGSRYSLRRRTVMLELTAPLMPSGGS
jgi:hypothetical protein